MNNIGKTKGIYRLFQIAVLVKGFDGVAETIAGSLLLFVRPYTLDSFVAWMTVREISMNPADPLAGALRHAAQALTFDTERFVSVYLLAHGIVKIVLAVGLLRELRWAFPTALWFLGIFSTYQFYRFFAHTHSIALLIFATIDVCVMWFVWREARLKQRRT